MSPHVETLPSDAPDGPTEVAGPTRRQVLGTAGVVGAAAVVTAACGSSSGGGTTPTSGAGGGGGPTVLGPTSDVAVGGGQVYPDHKVVVTQPTAGDFKGFTAICTHQGCTVASVSGGRITCPCHGSQYSITDGSVLQGPARGALAPVTVSVAGTNIELG